MKALDLKEGDEVTICSADGRPYNIVTVIRRDTYGKGGWVTSGEMHWTKSGLRDDGTRGPDRTKIVPTTDEHRRTLWLVKVRSDFTKRETWAGAPDDLVEQVAKLLGWVPPAKGGH